MNESAPQDTNDILPGGTRLMWYEIQRVLGRGGFAVTYLATDTNLKRAVALKEYLPMGLAQRADGGVCAKPGSETNFNWGRERFLAEAQTLARFKHPNIVRVVSFFEANNTAYLVMDFEEGQSLAAFLATHPTPDAAALMAIVYPLMDGMDELHRAGFIHRDIKPENIYLRRDGSPVLLDFGAARQALGGQTQNLTSLLSPGYAPMEQYFSEKDRQGPWSDIYALAAVMYRAISGMKPPEASLRSSCVINGLADPLTPAQQVGVGRYPAYLLRAIDAGLRLREKERPQSLAEWRRMMETPTRGADKVAPPNVSVPNFDQGMAPSLKALNTAPATASVPRAWTQPAPKEESPKRRGRALLYLLLGFVVAGLAYKATLRSSPAPRPPPVVSEPSPVLPITPQPMAAEAKPVDSTPPEPRPAESKPPEPPPAEPAPSPPPSRPPYDVGRLEEDRSMQPCRVDAETYCPGIVPGDGRFAACMRDNLHRFSDSCRPLVLQRLRGRAPRE